MTRRLSAAGDGFGPRYITTRRAGFFLAGLLTKITVKEYNSK